MYLKKLHISNFRCFHDYEIEFAPGVTVLFGKNGSGKSTLIHAIHKAMSFLMYSEEVKEKVAKGKKAKVLEVKTFRLNNPYPAVEGFSAFDCKYEGVKRSGYEININAQAVFGNSLHLEWNMTGVFPRMSLRKSGYRSKFMELYEWAKSTMPSPQLPLLAYYSDGFPHNTILNRSKSTEKTKRDFHLKNSFPELGYTDWNSDKGFTNVWLERLCNKLYRTEAIPRELNVFKRYHEAGKIDKEKYDIFKKKFQEELVVCNKEIAEITACLQRFTKGDTFLEIASLGIDITDRTAVCAITTDMERHKFSVLPAGYKRMLYIALDIAYRSFLLSGGQSTDIPGLVIIDEIDLHLHPELEQVVLGRFMKTFTKAQFVISTHSQAVLTGLSTVGEKNRIYKMEKVTTCTGDDAVQKGPVPMFDIYGLDLNTTMQLVMEVNPNDDELNRWISRCAYMIDNGLNEQAANLKKFIIQKGVLSEKEIDNRISSLLKCHCHEVDK